MIPAVACPCAECARAKYAALACEVDRADRAAITRVRRVFLALLVILGGVALTDSALANALLLLIAGAALGWHGRAELERRES